VKDRIGNPVLPGSLLAWHPRLGEPLIVQVIKVDDGGITLADADGKRQMTPASITLQTTVYIDGNSAQEQFVSELLAIVNPAAAAAMDKLLEQTRKQ
jgi:hypothetical protein